MFQDFLIMAHLIRCKVCSVGSTSPDSWYASKFLGNPAVLMLNTGGGSHILSVFVGGKERLLGAVAIK
jgi:hypothetical protein